jgi:regulator of sigma E protease
LLIKTLILKGTMIGEVAGPVGIYSLTSQFVKLGLIYVLQFAAFLSLNLAIINAIPFPALDGGRLLFLLIEKIKGKPINMKTEKLAHAIGFALLILLIIVITFRDVIKLF